MLLPRDFISTDKFKAHSENAGVLKMPFYVLNRTRYKNSTLC